MIKVATGIRKGDDAILVMNDDWHKKKCIYLFEPPNTYVHCATFHNDQMADEFLKTLRRIMGATE